MQKKDTIIVGTDFSGPSLESIGRTKKLAEVLNGPPDYFHVSVFVGGAAFLGPLESEEMSIVENTTNEQYQKSIQSNLENLTENAPPEACTVSFNIDSDQAIGDCAADCEAGLVVLGKRGHTALHDFVSDSTAEQVNHSGKRSVLIVS